MSLIDHRIILRDQKYENKIDATDSRTCRISFRCGALKGAVQLTESKTCFKSMKTKTVGRPRIWGISNTWWRVKIWSMWLQSWQNPACCSRVLLPRIGTRWRNTKELKILITTGTKLILWQPLQSLCIHSLKMNTNSGSLHDNGICSSFHVSSQGKWLGASINSTIGNN